MCWLNPGQELDHMEEHVKSGEGSRLSPEEPNHIWGLIGGGRASEELEKQQPEVQES